MKLSEKTIKAFERIGSVLRTDAGTFDEQAFDAAMEAFCDDREIIEDVADLLLQLGKKPEVGIGFSMVLGFVESAALDEDGTLPDQVERWMGSAMFSMAKEFLKTEEEETKEDEPV